MAVFDFIENSTLGSGFIYKNSTAAYVYSYATFTATTGTGTSVMNISAVTTGTVVVGMTVSGGTLGGTATITSFGTFNGTSGTVNISATETWANPTTVTGTGYIQITDVDYPATTVRGICFLDGTYYVMTPGAAIHGSEINDPFTWSALNVIQAQKEPDLGVALFRQLNLICALKEYSIEFFYDAGNATGSPLLPYDSAFLELGCASGESVAQAENTLFFIGRNKTKGRSVYKLEGTNPTIISTPFIDRIIQADDLANVKSFFIKLQGHGFYVLTLPSSTTTLVYDDSTGMWSKWTSLVYGVSQYPTAASWSVGIVTMSLASHGLSDGQYVVISGSNPSGYNYSGAITKVDADTLSYPITSDPGTWVGSTMIDSYTETYFNMASHTKNGNLDLVQDSTTGTVYTIDSSYYQDNGVPIPFKIRTSKFDGGSNKNKYFSRLELIGDKVSGTAHIRYTNDDYQTWSTYRTVDLSAPRSQIYRLGRGRRRAFEIVNYDNQPIRLEALEIMAEEGIR